MRCALGCNGLRSSGAVNLSPRQPNGHYRRHENRQADVTVDVEEGQIHLSEMVWLDKRMFPDKQRGDDGPPGPIEPAQPKPRSDRGQQRDCERMTHLRQPERKCYPKPDGNGMQ